MSNSKTVFVGLSGGVDSSVAALRLKNQGYEVVGVFIKVWHPDFMVCNWEEERLDAMRVAAHLEIPFLTCDAENAYRDEVGMFFINEYQAGRTPNPDVLCNQHVKFGAFLRFAEEKGAHYIATGHYAQNIEGKMHRGVDAGKDQTYFLWSLTNQQMLKSLFPVGDTPKEQIRLEAEKAGIPTATKKDSQGICFLGHVDIPEFLSHYVDLVPGNVLNTAGEIIGTHHGSLVYTIGQRHGFTITSHNSERDVLYVTGKNMTNNTIIVSSKKPVSNQSDLVSLSNIMLRADVSVGDTIQAQFRYRQTPFNVTITSLNSDELVLQPELAFETPASGQSCVLYRGEHCLGGGIIQ